jgi:hypothetical protein
MFQRPAKAVPSAFPGKAKRRVSVCLTRKTLATAQAQSVDDLSRRHSGHGPENQPAEAACLSLALPETRPRAPSNSFLGKYLQKGLLPSLH